MRKEIIPILLAFSFAANAQEIKSDSSKTSNIQEVVVTALGVKRQARSLTYSAQQIGGDELSAVKTPNLLNSINGKVSNVQINRTNGVGSSVRVIMRGDKSAAKTSPLYVIDGIPLFNGNGEGSPNIGQYSNMPDAGDVMSSLNSDDIESINFLKGASASALYGSAGGNGVVLITTKKGRAGKSSLSYNTSLTLDKAYSLPKLQYNYLSYDPSIAGSAEGLDVYSWGAKGDSKDYLKDFLQTGATWVNSLSFQSGNEKSTNYFSIGNTTNKGIVPTSTFDQYNVSFRNSSKYLDDKLTLDASFIGSLQNSVNRQTPGMSFSPLVSLYWLPRGVDFDQYSSSYASVDPRTLLPAQNWWEVNTDGTFKGNPSTQNPYWVLNRNKVTTSNRNTYTAVSLSYQINTWLSARLRGNYNWNTSESQRQIAAYSAPGLLATRNVDQDGNTVPGTNNGRWLKNTIENSSTYGDALLIGNPKISDDFSLDFTIGASINTIRQTITSIDNSHLVNPNLFLESNLSWPTDKFGKPLPPSDGNHNSYSSTKQQTQSVFASTSIGYKNLLYVDLTYRNDWDSTLAYTGTYAYDYQSAGINAILSSIFKLPETINFWKVRGSYATVGLGLSPNKTYTIINSPYSSSLDNGYIIPATDGYVPEGLLFPRPELNKTFEVGTEFRLLKNRLNFDFTYYNSNSTNQLLPITIASNFGGVKSGSYTVNAGKIRNTGFESSLSYKVFSMGVFSWTTTLNGSANKNKIVELFPDALNVPRDWILGLSGGGRYTKLVLGGSFGDLYGTKFQRDDQGHILVDKDGVPLTTTGSKPQYLGNPNPKFMLGFGNDFNIGRFGISFLIDGKFGGQVLSLTQKANDLYGVSQETVDARNAGGISIPNAVYGPGTSQAGSAYTGLTDVHAYYGKVGGVTDESGIDEAYIYKATNIRLRQAAISYTFNVNGTYMRNSTISLMGTNLFFFYKKAPFDPEQVSGNTPGGVGVDSFGIPITRSVGLSLKANF